MLLATFSSTPALKLGQEVLSLKPVQVFPRRQVESRSIFQALLKLLQATLRLVLMAMDLQPSLQRLLVMAI